AAQYMGRPANDSAAMFPRAAFERRWTELPDRFDREVISVDASFKEGKSRDYAVIQHWGARGADRFLTEQWRKQAGFSETTAALRAMASRHRFAKVLIEGAANGHAIIDQLRREFPGVV